MGIKIRWKYRSISKDRPKKKQSLKNRRIKEHRARLVKMGVPREVVEKLNADKLRMLLRRPKKIKKILAGMGIKIG